MAIIEVTGLQKAYGAHAVLRGIDLTVNIGEIVGILGPNGAGKTTAVECIGGLRTPDAGRIRVADLDPTRGDPRLRQILGMQLQECELPARITTAEAIDLFASFHSNPRPTGELLERFGLTSQRNQRFEKLSGGQQQRLSVALALVGRPRIAILDELTTGLDPAARRDIWAYLEALASEGTTILLVTHSMEEAQYLCDRLYIIDSGRVRAHGTPQELSAETGVQTISFIPSSRVALEDLRRLPGIATAQSDGVVITVTGNEDAPQSVLTELIRNGITAGHLRVSGPSLDEAYLAATEPAHVSEGDSA